MGWHNRMTAGIHHRLDLSEGSLGGLIPWVVGGLIGVIGNTDNLTNSDLFRQSA